ncbi:MAG: hypothetical protein ACOCV2_08840 [Persicimonas sp.]
MGSGSDKSSGGRTSAFWGGIACFLLAAVVAGVWVAHGAKFVTQYQVQETVVEEDEFGDEIERKEMVDRFRFGLMPDKGYDGAAPVGGGLLAIGVALMWVDRKRRKKAASKGEVRTDEQSK